MRISKLFYLEISLIFVLKIMSAKKISSRTLGLVAFGIGALGFLLIGLPYYFFPSFYVSKNNPVLGYLSPKTQEGWMLLATGLFLIMFSIVVTFFYGLRRLEEGKWVNKPFTLSPV